MRNNLKKILKIFSINIFIFALLLVSLNIYIDKIPKEKNLLNTMFKPLDRQSYMQYDSFKFSSTNIEDYPVESAEELTRIEHTDESLNRFCGEDRTEFKYIDSIGGGKNLAPIVVLGCSYAYGHGLKKEESFPYLLSQNTKRPVYNYAGCGGHIMNNLNAIKGYSNNEENPLYNADYVIYVYMHDHINRYLWFIYDESACDFLCTTNTERMLFKIPLTRLIISQQQLAHIFKTGNYAGFIKKIILKSRDELKKIAPNAKMIIILYDEKLGNLYSETYTKFEIDILNDKIWDEINEENDISVLHTKDVTGFIFDKDYKLKEDIEDWHPNAKAWEVFTPLFAEKYIK